MSKSMLIDSAHSEEIRIAVVDGEKLDKFDFETPSKAQIKGNIYLAKIIRVEPSLQAAFVDYGSEKHGFLSFSEIHHDYFQIPIGDRHDLERHIQNAISALQDATGDAVAELDEKEIAKLRYQFYRRYKIQEVIKKRQIMLVQVTKEERGNKGAALTTYISLAGRYCILMPNTAKGSGVSKKVSNSADRAKLKKIVADLNVENGCTVIRTAGIGHSKSEIAKDFSYLQKTWNEIRELTVKSTAPCLIHEEASIIKRAIRDLYSRDIESIFVEGEEGYKIAKNYIKKLMPSHAKKVKLYEDKKLPLFSKFKINNQISQIYSTRVDLPSGGYLIINGTEALISIDVNSGKATRERNIAETALKTNLEAAVEIARQCRLRDLGGLVVVDFIDMGEKRNNIQVERRLRDALREDKAKIQVGMISNFGLLEFSRQRLRASIADTNMVICPHCSGSGFMWSHESIAIQVLRKIEETLAVMDVSGLNVTLSTTVAMYILNNKRQFISQIEERSNSKITFNIDSSIPSADFRIEQTIQPVGKEEDKTTAVATAPTPTTTTSSANSSNSANNEDTVGGTAERNNNNNSAESENNVTATAVVSKIPVKPIHKHGNFQASNKKPAQSNNVSNELTENVPSENSPKVFVLPVKNEHGEMPMKSKNSRRRKKDNRQANNLTTMATDSAAATTIALEEKALDNTTLPIVYDQKPKPIAFVKEESTEQTVETKLSNNKDKDKDQNVIEATPKSKRSKKNNKQSSNEDKNIVTNRNNSSNTENNSNTAITATTAATNNAATTTTAVRVININTDNVENTDSNQANNTDANANNSVKVTADNASVPSGTSTNELKKEKKPRTNNINSNAGANASNQKSEEKNRGAASPLRIKTRAQLDAELMSVAGDVIKNVSEMLGNYKEQETTLDLHPPEETAAPKKKKKGNAGWWQKLLKNQKSNNKESQL